MQVQSEVVLFQGSLSCSGLDYAVDYMACISVFHVFHHQSDVNFVIPKWFIAIPLVSGLFSQDG